MIPGDSKGVPAIQRGDRVVVKVDLDGHEELVDLAVGSVEAKIPQNPVDTVVVCCRPPHPQLMSADRDGGQSHGAQCSA